MYIPQKQLENLKKLLAPGKVIVILGPRRCGKTTLLNKFLEKAKEKYLLFQGEDFFTQKRLSSQSVEKLKNLVGDHKLLVIDEAQKIENIGLNLKLIVDHVKDIKIIATGSSSFDLTKNVGEPLTGRKYTLKLFPLAQLEISGIENSVETESNLEKRLIFGSYPVVVLEKDEEKNKRYLKEIISSYLFKDILELEGVRHSGKLIKILQLLAYQIGKEVSLAELGTQLEMSKNTVSRYLYLLEEVFVIFRLTGFSRNLRKEISKSSRYYFWDNGIRNALINNYNPLDLRDDGGMLWENYIVIERMKKQEYQEGWANNYFWRTYDQKEIDLVEEKSGRLFGYEIKWGKKRVNPPKDWLNTYKNASYLIVDKKNYLKFIT